MGPGQVCASVSFRWENTMRCHVSPRLLWAWGVHAKCCLYLPTGSNTSPLPLPACRIENVRRTQSERGNVEEAAAASTTFPSLLWSQGVGVQRQVHSAHQLPKATTSKLPPCTAKWQSIASPPSGPPIFIPCGIQMGSIAHFSTGTRKLQILDICFHVTTEELHTLPSSHTSHEYKKWKSGFLECAEQYNVCVSTPN